MTRKRKKFSKKYLAAIGIVLAFFLVVAGICVFFYKKSEEKMEQTTYQVQLKNKAENENRLNLYYIGLKNIPFLQGDEGFIVKYERYLKNTLNLKKITTTIFFSNYKRLSENVYILYSQIDDASSSVIQTVYNSKDRTCDFSKSDKKIENIEELGGVSQGGKETLEEKYNTHPDKIVYAQIENPEKQTIPEAVASSIQQFTLEKYRATDVTVDHITAVGSKEEGNYQIYSFKLDDLIGTMVEVYCKNGAVVFTMER